MGTNRQRGAILIVELSVTLITGIWVLASCVPGPTPQRGTADADSPNRTNENQRMASPGEGTPTLEIVALPPGFPTPAFMNTEADVLSMIHARSTLPVNEITQEYARHTYYNSFIQLRQGMPPGFQYDPTIFPQTPTSPAFTPELGEDVWVIGIRSMVPISEATIDELMQLRGVRGDAPPLMGRELYFVVDHASNILEGGFVSTVDEKGQSSGLPWALEDILTLPQAQ